VTEISIPSSFILSLLSPTSLMLPLQICPSGSLSPSKNLQPKRYNLVYMRCFFVSSKNSRKRREKICSEQRESREKSVWRRVKGFKRLCNI
jgi:hypothetical protein